jgi:adenylyltransferase/sulfurtransferase
MNSYQRYARQLILPQIGPAGQEKLRKSKIIIVGSGGLGCTISQILVRGGLGEIILYDDDRIDLENLHRQILFDESDIGRFKAEAAAEKLSRMNHDVRVKAVVGRVSEEMVDSLFTAGASLVVDATDNLHSRYLLNAAAVRAGADWMYGGCVGMEGTVMLICGGRGACLECIFGPKEAGDQPRPTEKFPVGPATPVAVGAIEANEVIRYLVEGNEQKGVDKACSGRYISINLWQARVWSNQLPGRNPECGTCGREGGKVRRCEKLEK